MKQSAFIRNTIFGIEDGLVSTVGLLSGIAAAGVPQHTILLTGVVLVFVEAFSMGVGSLISDHEEKEYELHAELPIKRSTAPGVVMFISYFLAGLIPLSPYAFLATRVALWFSIGGSLLALIILGMVAGRLARIPPLKQGLQMLGLGGMAIALGIIVGQFLN